MSIVFKSSELSRPESCVDTMRQFELATGCDDACSQDEALFIERKKTFCSGLPEEECGLVIAPCQTANATASTRSVDSASLTDDPAGTTVAAKKTKGGSGGANKGAVLGGVLGGFSALLALAFIAVLVVHVRKGKREQWENCA